MKYGIIPLVPAYLPILEEDIAHETKGCLLISSMTEDMRKTFIEENPCALSDMTTTTESTSNYNRGYNYSSNTSVPRPYYKGMISKAIDTYRQKSRNTKVKFDLQEYGNLTISSIASFNLISNHMSNTEDAINRVVDSLTNEEVLVVGKNATYDEIHQYAMQQLKKNFDNKNIILLCKMICGGGSAFNDTRQALYRMKPSIKGMIKSGEVLEAMNLTSFFTVAEFSDYPDEVIALMFKHVIVEEEEVDRHLLYGLSDHGNQFVRIQSSDSINDSAHVIDKIKYHGQALKMSWIITMIGDRFDMTPQCDEGATGDESQDNLFHDMSTISESVESQFKVLPIKLSADQLDQMIEYCGRGKTVTTAEKGKMPIIHTDSLPMKYELSIRGLRKLTGSAIRDLLKKYKVSGSGNKNDLTKKLVTMLVKAYEESFDQLYGALKDYRGIVIDRLLSSSAKNLNNNKMVRRRGKRDRICNLLSEETKKKHDNMVLDLITYAFIRLHMSHDTIYNPEFTNDLYNAKGLMDHIIESQADIDMTLIPEMKELTDPNAVAPKINVQVTFPVPGETPCPF